MWCNYFLSQTHSFLHKNQSAGDVCVEISLVKHDHEIRPVFEFEEHPEQFVCGKCNNVDTIYIQNKTNVSSKL
jgi:hypothetical protein